MKLSRSPRSLSALAATLALACFACAALDVAATAQNPLTRKQQTQDRPFVGTFTGEGIRLELAWDGMKSNYAGTLIYDGERYSCVGDSKGAVLNGKFFADGDSYAFTATLTGDRLELSSDGETASLQRLGTRPAPGINPAPVTPAGARGGVGIALRPNQRGELVIAEIAPGSPAARARLAPGGILRAVDGKDVEGMSLEQVVALVGGPIGEIVTLTIETDDEVLEAMIERAALGGQPATDNGRANPAQPQFGARPDAPRPAAGGLPSTIHPGVRITWYLGSATLNGVRSQLVQDDKGNWVDSQGRRFADAENPNTAGAGYLQLTVLAADAQGIAGDARNFLMLDPQRGQLTSSYYTAMVGDAEQLGDYWVHPRKLAAMQETNTPTYRVMRMRYPLDGREFNAIAIETRGAQGYFRNTYDLDTGLLIAGSSSTTGSVVPTVDPSGRVSPGAGATTITSTRLVNLRDLELPWAGSDAAPGFRGGETLNYGGTYSTVIPGVPEMPWGYGLQVQVQSAQRGFLACKSRTRTDTGYGEPMTTEGERVFGTAMLGGVFVPPDALQALRPNQVVDEDPVTHFRTTFAGVQGGRAMFVEQGPMETNQYVYDTQNGILTDVSVQQSNGVGTTVIRIGMQGRR